MIMHVLTPPFAGIIDRVRNHSFYTWGRDGSTVPLLFDVSGVPSPFLLLLGSLAISVECFVSVLEMPSCFPDIELVGSPGVLADAACGGKKSATSTSFT